MNNLIRVFVILSFIIRTTHADQFQLKLKEGKTASGFDVSYAKVTITADHGFTGMADKLGRVAINGLKNGHTPQRSSIRAGNKKTQALTSMVKRS